jgi:hypothetical protein
MWSFDVSSPGFAFFFTKMISPLVITGPGLLLNIIHDNGLLMATKFYCYWILDVITWCSLVYGEYLLS